MHPRAHQKNSLEILEARIAPATLPTDPSAYVTATLGAPIELKAGQVLTTGGFNSGKYLLHLEKGNALVFITDLNNNKDVDFNEITGIAAGDGMRLVSFVDIHGDIVTNLQEQVVSFLDNGVVQARTILTLSDTDSNSSNDSPTVRGDGRVLLNKRIEKIELRSLRIEDITDQNADGVVDATDVALRQAESTYSIFGSIFAGRGFGLEGDANSGLIIDATGGTNFGFDLIPKIGSIKTGTAVSGEFFTFGASRADDISGKMVAFTPERNQVGGDIINVRQINTTLPFNIDVIHAGDGGVGARGGNIANVTLIADDTGGYQIIAGAGGRGPSGGVGGSIINFTDFGSRTSEIVIRSGEGGTGSTGSGGNGGDISLGIFNVFGDINIEMGPGGDGFTAGGNGASLERAELSQPDPGQILAGNAFGVSHIPSTSVGGYVARFGTQEAVDFDNDGFGDFVYTTKDLSQLVVTFGTQPNPFTGIFRTRLDAEGVPELDRIYLPGSRNAAAMVIADLNADGHPDIATGSQDQGSHAGILVFLSQFEDVNNDGVLSPSEDLNGNGQDDFLGFSSPIFSVLPQMATLDPDRTPDIDPYALSVTPWWESPHQINNLVAGDFDGDGRTELAAVITQYRLRSVDANGVVTSLTAPSQILVFLRPEEEFNNVTGQDELTGQFYVDFGDKRTETPGGGIIPAQPLTPFILIDPLPGGIPVISGAPGGNGGEPTRVIIETTALSDLATHDVILIGRIGLGFPNYPISAVDWSTPAVDGPIEVGTWSLGRVDTNRQLSDAQTRRVSLVDATLQDFTILDYDNDGLVDVAFITDSPDGFLVGIKGDGTGSGTPDSGDDDNAGNFFGNEDFGFGFNDTTLYRIKAADFDGDGLIDNLAILNPRTDVSMVIFAAGPQDGVGDSVHAGEVDMDRQANDTNAQLAIYRIFADPANPLSTYPIFAVPDHETAPQNASFAPIVADDPPPNVNLEYFFSDPAGAFVETTTGAEPALRLKAGDGGSALIGKGGVGGSIGAGASVRQVLDPFTGQMVPELVGTVQLTVNGINRFVAGIGGDGFSSGGNGGGLNGLVVRDRPDNIGLGVTVISGDGGRGIAASGGSGGNVSQFSIEANSTFIQAGNGGPGLFGGAGGSILGNRTSIFDADTVSLLVYSGNGGLGTKRGGAGGDIMNLAPIISGSSVSGTIQMIAGDGGDSVLGPGGNGGAVLNNSPRPNAFVSQDIWLEAGNGGDGTTGGNGGAVSGFRLTLNANSKNPALVSFLAGDGGVGSSGNGGRGGNVSDVTVPSLGNSPTPLYFNEFFVPFKFNRAIAGDGGASAGGAGGAGGNVSNLVSSATQGTYAVVGGAGGDGLTIGGQGGAVLSTSISQGESTTAKVLVIGGAGGGASAFIPNPNDDSPNQAQNAFGGRIGKGGDGGNISGFVQQGSTGSHVDLIGGNGGNTLNYGTPIDTKPFVGRGGSILNVRISSFVGNIDAAVPIKSYNDIFAGQSVADFVNTKLIIGDNFAGTTLSDFDGNVGIVVGSAGRNKAVLFNPDDDPTNYRSQPANFAQNGSLIDLTARSIMSAIAGNVNLIASIQAASGIKLLGGVAGTDKGVLGVPEFLDADGNLIPSPVRDGRLLDGAFITKSLTNPPSLPGNLVFL